MSRWIGRTLSKVTIERPIAKGGMAEIYLGRHETLERPVAVKVLHAYLSEDSQLMARFETEAKAVAALQHPNIVRVYDFDFAEGQPYIVMELIEGPTLAQYLRSLHNMGLLLPLDAVGRQVSGLASALDYAHGRGIVHRDVKPSNVLLRAAGSRVRPGLPLGEDVQPVLTDFGLARITGGSYRTATGTVMGTPAYMSPEQVRGRTCRCANRYLLARHHAVRDAGRAAAVRLRGAHAGRRGLSTDQSARPPHGQRFSGCSGRGQPGIGEDARRSPGDSRRARRRVRSSPAPRRRRSDHPPRRAGRAPGGARQIAWPPALADGRGRSGRHRPPVARGFRLASPAERLCRADDAKPGHR